MATWYVDYDNGSDNNSGDSASVTLNLTDAVVTGTSSTMTSVTGGFTGLSGRKIFIVGVGGRTINSVTNNNTIVLNATVSGGTYTINIGGRRKTITNMTTTNCQGITTNDTVRVAGSPAPTSCSCVANFDDCQETIVLCGTSETLITDCETAWTASANVTATADSTIFKVGTKSAKIDIAAGFTTGKAAYFATGTLDLSTKQVLKFWMYQSAGTVLAANQISIRLCSDTTGTTAVNIFSLPGWYSGGNGHALNRWHPICVDLGSLAGASIQSIAFYVNSDAGAQTFYLDDIRICDAPNLTKSVSTCETAWTASANVTTTTSTTKAEGTNSTSIAIGAAFTTGKAAYLNLGTTLDLSAYKQVCFWFRQSSGTLVSASQMSLRFCSDTTGDTPVNTIAIPSISASATGLSHQMVVNTGAALGSAIKSIALYVDSDAGAQTVLLDNIFVSKDSTSNDAITFQSLLGTSDSIGCGGADTDTFYGIYNAVNNTINIGCWCGTSGFYTVYKQETTKLPYISGATTGNEIVNVSGLILQGGYDRTNMSTQNLQTWFDGGNYNGTVVTGAFSIVNVSLARIGAVRGGRGLGVGETGWTIISCPGLNNNLYGINCGFPASLTITNLLAACNNPSYNISISCTGLVTITYIGKIFGSGPGVGAGNRGIALGRGGTYIIDTIDTIAVNSFYGMELGEVGYNTLVTINNLNKCSANHVRTSNTGGGIVINSGTYLKINNLADCSFNSTGLENSSPGGFVEIDTMVANRNSLYGIRNSGILKVRNFTATTNVAYGYATYNNAIQGATTIYNYTSSGNGSASVDARYGQIWIVNPNISEATKFLLGTNGAGGIVNCFRNQSTNGAFSIFMDGGTIARDTTVNRTTGTASWKISPTSTNIISDNPIELNLVRFTAESGKTYTIQCYLLRDSSNVSARLICKKNQLQGISSDVFDDNVAFVNSSTWEPLSISISPTETGYVEVLIRAWGGTTNNAWIDDVTINDGTNTYSVSIDYSDVFFGPGSEPLPNLSGGSAGMLYIPNMEGL